MIASISRGFPVSARLSFAALLPLLAVPAYGQQATLQQNAIYFGANFSSNTTFVGAANGSNFNNANLSNTVFTGGFNLRGAFFNSTNLTNTRLLDADFTGAQMQTTNFTGANLSRAILDNVLITAPSNPATRISAAQLRSVASASGMTLAGSYSGYDLTGVNFTNANLTQTNLANVNFTNATLTGASLNGDLGGVNFTGANLAGLNLSNKASGQHEFNQRQCHRREPDRSHPHSARHSPAPISQTRT